MREKTEGHFFWEDSPDKSRQYRHPERMRRISLVRKSLGEKRFFTSFRMTIWCFSGDSRLLSVGSAEQISPSGRDDRWDGVLLVPKGLAR